MSVPYGPRRLNSFTIGMVLVMAVVGYGFWLFFPVYWDSLTVEHLASEAAAAVYKINNFNEPERTNGLTALLENTKAQVVEVVKDPDTLINLDITNDKVVLSAEYNVVVVHPWFNKKTHLHFRKTANADIKKVKWEE